MFYFYFYFYFFICKRSDLFCDNKRSDLCIKKKKSDLFLYMKRKYEKDFFYENDFIQETNLCYMDKANTTNIVIHDLFLYFKICYVKK